MSPLLLGACICCGEPIFRHRTVRNRQISCEQLRQIDQAFKASGAQPQQSVRAANVISGEFDGARQGDVR